MPNAVVVTLSATRKSAAAITGIVDQRKISDSPLGSGQPPTHCRGEGRPGGMFAASHECTHVKGHDGVKGHVREMQARLPQYPCVACFEVTTFYDSIVHAVLPDQRGWENGVFSKSWDPDMTFWIP